MLANPLLDFERLLVLKRKRGQLGLPTNHQCNTALKQRGYDNELAVLSSVRSGVGLQTVFRPKAGWFVGEIDLHFDADRLLFTMPNGRTWQIHEIGIDGQRAPAGLARSARTSTTSTPATCPTAGSCFAPPHPSRASPAGTAGNGPVACISMNADGGERAAALLRPGPGPASLRAGQRPGDLQPLGLHGHAAHLRAAVDGDESRRHGAAGRVRQQLVLSQQSVLSSGVPGHPNKIVAILAGYHGMNRMGELVVLDIVRGLAEAKRHRASHHAPRRADRPGGARQP